MQLEGTDNSDNGGNLAFMIPSAEAIETVGVTTSNDDAEFGRAGGAVTNVTLKIRDERPQRLPVYVRQHRGDDGAQPLHIVAADGHDIRSGGLYSRRADQAEQALLLRGLRTNDDSGRITRAHVPEAAFRTGDFSSAPTTIYDPATGGAAGVGRTAFPDNQIPANRISPIARRLLDKIPMPNIAGAPVGTINYEKPYVREKRTNQFNIKITYQAAQNDNLSFRYSHQNARTLDPGTFGVWGGVKDYAGSGTNPTYNMAINYNRVWSASIGRLFLDWQIGDWQMTNCQISICRSESANLPISQGGCHFGCRVCVPRGGPGLSGSSGGCVCVPRGGSGLSGSTLFTS